MQSTDTLKTITDSLLNEGHLRKIQEFTQETASNTAFSFWREADFWEYMAIGLSVIAILLAVVTAIAQWKTERNTRMALSMKTQVYESIFKSLLNDLYRIQCDILSLQIVLIEDNFLSYPTERYLKCMMIKFDDSNLDSFLIVFNEKYKREAEEHYLRLQEITNRHIRNYNVNVEMLMKHLKDSSIDINTKLLDFSIIYNSIGFLSREIIQIAKSIYGENSDVGGPSLLHYVKTVLDFYPSSKNHITSKDDYVNLKKYEDIIDSVFNDYFKYTNISNTKEIMLSTYKLISYELENSGSGVKRNLIKFKS